jgi:Ni/Fe-hydrogenase 1 B-type cytochrome subunit
MHNPTRVDHPIVFVITHWINLLAMFFLALSGFYIHFPFVSGIMGLARGTHFFWMFVLLINMFVRIVLAFFVKDGVTMDGEVATDWHNFWFQKVNRHQLWPTVKYYLFFKKEAPISAKYGVLQKIAYVATIPMILLAAWTGFSIWGPTMNWPFFVASRELVSNWFGTAGGADPMNMRILHYYTMWLILIFTAIHAYLANIYNFNPSKMIFAWKEVGDAHGAAPAARAGEDVA